MKAVDGEMMKLGNHALDVDRTSSSYAQDQSKIMSNGSGFSDMGEHPLPTAYETGPNRGGHGIYVKDTGSNDKFAAPGGTMEITPKTKGGLKLATSD